jgi:WS/DGAT/MGAT family acyltransferase
MTANPVPMTKVDTAWRRMDTDVNLMMIVGVWLLQPAISHAALTERVRARLLRFDRFRQKVVVGTLGAEWVEDGRFDLARHVVIEKLHPRKGQTMRAALQQRMGVLASTPLDPEHPLWQFHLVEDFDGGSATLCRIHHCVGDGVALNSVMMSICDDGVQPPERDDGGADPHESHLGDRIAAEWLKPLTGLAVKAIDMAGGAVVKTLQWIERPREALAAAQAVAHEGVQLLDDVAALALLPDDSPTRLKGHGSGRKAVAWCEPLPLDPVKSVGKALGASINDVLLSCAAGAIGSYLRAHGDDTTGCDIRALVPVNLRPLEDAWQLGNRFGLVPLLVPVGIENPIERLGVVHARMEALKGSYQPLLSYGILGLSGMLVAPAQRALSNLFLDKTTAVMTNVPGPPKPLHICGAAVRQNIFWVPASGDVGMGVSIISYAGGVQFGLITDAKLCPQPRRIIDRFAREFEQLLLLTLMLPWDGLKVEHR